MYTVGINGVAHEFVGEDVQIEQGNLLIYRDKKESRVEVVVPASKWEYLQVSKDRPAMYFARPEAKKPEVDNVDNP